MFYRSFLLSNNAAASINIHPLSCSVNPTVAPGLTLQLGPKNVPDLLVP